MPLISMRFTSIFEKCRYIFLTGSRIGRGTSLAVRPDNKTVTFATDIDFLVSRFWFKLNKQLVPNQIPVSLDIVARSQAVLTREVSRKVRALYEELKQKNLSESVQKTLYANLTEAEKYLAPYSDATTEDILTFIDFKNIDDLIENQKILRRKVADAEKKERELSEAKGKLAQQEVEIAGLKNDMVKKEEENKITQENATAKDERQGRTIKQLKDAIVVLVIIIFALAIFLFIK